MASTDNASPVVASWGGFGVCRGSHVAEKFVAVSSSGKFGGGSSGIGSGSGDGGGKGEGGVIGDDGVCGGGAGGGGCGCGGGDGSCGCWWQGWWCYWWQW